MSVLMIPADDTPYPTLGGHVCEFIESELCHGPGDLIGQPVRLSPELKAFIYRLYEIEPEKLMARKRQVISKSANPRAGRRRFQRCALSLRKGSAKTEFAAWIAIAELHPEGPVRCKGFVGNDPIPGPVIDPYIPMISYSEEQTEELAYGALRRILDLVSIGSDFDIGLERVIRLDGRGKAEAVSTSPNARDGARTTFQHADETHRLVFETQKKAWTVMLANLAKRPLADPWALETTTAPEPGVGSVAENTMEYARQVAAGTASGSRLFFYHRQASEEIDISTRRGLKAAIVEASGPYIAKWSDIDRIADSFEEPGADRPYLERVWLNRLVQSSGLAFKLAQWKSLASDFTPPFGSAVALGFDGSRYDDSTALIGAHIETGHLFRLGIWEAPRLEGLAEDDRKRVEKAWVQEISDAVDDAFSTYFITRMYCDPPNWTDHIATWAGKYGEKRVAEWWTNRRRPMAYAIRAFLTAMEASEMSQDGDALFADHIANSRQAASGLFDEQEKPLWLIRKERPQSPKKIDAAVTAILAWEARSDSIAAGEEAPGEPALHFLKFGT